MDRTAPAAPAARPARPFRAAVLLLAALAVAGLGAYEAVARSETLRIQAIRFQGLSRAREAELLELSPVKPGDSMITADLDAMEQALTRAPWVKRAEVRRRLPSALEVRVTEREAAALVELSGLYLMDREGQVFKRAAPGDGLDLPVLTGFTREDYVKRRADLEPLLLGALALLESYARSPLGAATPISEVHVDLAEGVTLYVGEGTQVRLGIGDLPAKLARLEKITSALRAGGKKAEVLHLDNRIHPDWVTVRLAGAGAAQGRGGSSPRGR